jgi:hypothetical protein
MCFTKLVSGSESRVCRVPLVGAFAPPAKSAGRANDGLYVWDERVVTCTACCWIAASSVIQRECAWLPCTTPSCFRGVQASGFRVQSSGFSVQGAEFRAQRSGCRVQGSAFRVQGSGFRVQGSGFRIQGSGFRVQGLGSRVQGTWFRVLDSRFNRSGYGLKIGCGLITWSDA